MARMRDKAAGMRGVPNIRICVTDDQRRSITVSTIRMTTETMVNSAPDFETTLEVTCTDMPTPVTWTAIAQVTAAAISCKSATRLVARWMAPICVRSPNREHGCDQADDDRRKQPRRCATGRAMSPMKTRS